MLEKFLDRTSVRDFTNDKLTKEEVELLTKVINNAPTSTNSQQFSAIIIDDQETKDFISKNNWNQKHIADSAAFILFVADRTRINHVLEEVNIEPTRLMKNHDFMRSTIDATIGATYAHDALIELGYGVTFVGGVLGFGDELAKKVNLPEENMIVVGLSVGKPSKINPLKPKMNKVFINKYSKEEAIKETDDYNERTYSYFTDRGSKSFKENVIGHNKKHDQKTPFEISGEYVDNKYKKFK